MRKISITLVCALLAIANVMADDLTVNVQTLYKNNKGEIERAIPEVHFYHVENGSVTYFGQTGDKGMMNTVKENRMKIFKLGSYVFRYILVDGVRFNTKRNVWEKYVKEKEEDEKGVWMDATTEEVERMSITRVHELKIDCKKYKGNATETIKIYLDLIDKSKEMDLMMRRTETVASTQLTLDINKRDWGGMENEDGAAVGEYESFGVRFSVPKDSLKPHYRIVAQPVWIDKKLNLTYYGDPLVYFNRDYFITQYRESAYELAPHQEGFLFYDGDPRPHGEAYSQDRGPVEEYLCDFSLTDRPELHKPSRSSDYVDSTKYYFRVPFYIRVDESMRNNDCAALVKWVVTDYTKILSEHCDTVILGRSDPLRFMRYNVGGFMEPSYNETANQYWFPQAEKGAHDENKELKLLYETGERTLNLSRPENIEAMHQVDSLIRRVQAIERSNVAGIMVIGHASPDGNKERNEELARSRAKNFCEIISGRYPGYSTIIESDSEVVPWEKVADLLRAKGLLPGEEGDPASEADIRAAAGSKEELKKYLDEVRTTQLSMAYVITSDFTDEELCDIYENKPSTLQPFMYHRLYRYYASEAQNDWHKAEKICQAFYDDAKQRYKAELDSMHAYVMKPLKERTKGDDQRYRARIGKCHELLLFASDLCAIKLHRNEADTTLLNDFLALPEAPPYRNSNGESVGYMPSIPYLNQAACYLLNRRYSMARNYLKRYNFVSSKTSDASASGEFELVVNDLIEINKSAKNITEERIERLAAVSPINKVVCTLAQPLATSDELVRICENAVALGNDSVAADNIVRALAYGHEYLNRTGTYKVEDSDLYDEQLVAGARYLKMALDQDPSYAEMAQAQRDLKPLYKVIDRIVADDRIVKNIRITRRNRARELKIAE